MNLSVTTFLEAFFPSDTEPVYLFGLDAKGCPEQLRQPPARIATSRRELRENRSFQVQLKTLNENRGLYFTVNSGGTKTEQINRINAVFAEIDDRPLIEQNDIFDNCLFPPSVRVETLRSIHAYWLIDGDLSVEDFTQIQYGLIGSLHSDPAINNPNRLMRLPFFNHVSFDAGEYLFKPVTVPVFNPDHRFTADELQQAFPYTTPNQIEYKHHFPQNDAETVMQELRWRIMEHPTYRKNGEWGNMQGVCHQGKSKTALGLNLRTGKVHCFFGCEYKHILRQFGLEFPEKRFDEIKPKFVPRKPQQSKTYKYLKEVLGNETGDRNA